MAGLLVGIEEIIFAISIGSLVFSGELLPYLPHGIGIALVTAAVLMISISMLSSIKSVIGSLQDSPSVIIAIMVASLAAGLSAASLELKFATVVVIIAITSLLTGLLLLAVGYFKLGGLFRFIPYPVIGGFLAGTGWLLVRGSFRSMADFSLSLSNVQALLQPDQLIVWLPGLIFAFILFLGLHRSDNLLTMPAILFSAILIFYLALFVTGTSINETLQRGLLLGDSLGEANWQLIHFSSLKVASWPAILGQAGNVAIILILSVIGLLINTSALELSLKQDINLNHELRTAGIANILSGLGGGMVGYHTLDASGLSTRLGSRSRLVGIIAGAMCLAVLFAGASLLVFFPKFILGGLLFFLGMDFLFDWVIMGWSKLSKIDYLVVILILAVIATTSFLTGVAVGLAAMIIIFVVNYSRVDVVRHAMSGAELNSNVERLEQQQRVLRKFGDQVYILELQGFIFFGTANALLDRIRVRLADKEKLPVLFMILDFRRVSGLDSSAVFSFIKCKQIAEEQGIRLAFTGVNDTLYRQMEIGDLFNKGAEVKRFPDLDRGLEWCEEHLLQEHGVSEITLPVSLYDRLVSAGLQGAIALRLLEYLQQLKIKPGEYLVHQGEKANNLFFIESGKLSIYLELENNERVRLQTLDLRTVVGEMGLYLDTSRTASIIADDPSVAYRLSRSELVRLKQQDPEIAAALHEFVARMLAERLADTTRLIATLSK
jgi:SulP family sulfate permease